MQTGRVDTIYAKYRVTSRPVDGAANVRASTIRAEIAEVTAGKTYTKFNR